jgi:hypothetical protein
MGPRFRGDDLERLRVARWVEPLRNPSQVAIARMGFASLNPSYKSRRAPACRRLLLHPPVQIARAAAPSGHAWIGVDELVGGELVDGARLRLALPIRE